MGKELRETEGFEKSAWGPCMTATMPIASFLIPVYNGEAYLVESIDSALAQTEKNIEIVVVDDGSTDSTREILRRYAAQDARVRVFEEKHKGLVPTLNRGLEVARGKYVCRLDADDIAMPDRVEKQMRFLNEHEDYVLVGGQAANINEAGNVIGSREHPLTHEAIRSQFSRSCCFTHSCVMFKRVEVLNAGGYDPRFAPAEDYELWVRLAEHYRLANLPDVVCRYRIHQSQIASSHALRQVFATMCVQATFRAVGLETIWQSLRAEEGYFIPALRRIGYRDKDIAAGVAGHWLVNASLLNAGGSHGSALRILSELKGHLKQLKGSSRYLAQAYSWEFRVSLSARNHPRAARSLLLAFAYAPAKTARNIFTRLFAPMAILRRAQTDR